jgi:tetratricopeptide (TPR) repeat protein
MEPLPDIPPVEPAPPAPLEAPAPEPPPPLDAGPEERLHLARERARHGDWEGTRLVLAPLLDATTGEGFTARYLHALSLEFEGRLDEALARYDALLVEDATDDVRFRRAETLGKLGRFDDARLALREVSGRSGLGPADRVKLEALEGAWDLGRGKVKKGEKALRRLIEAPPSEEPTFYLALARLTLLERATDTAAGLAFTGSDRERARNLERRAALVLDAEQQLAGLIRLGETRPALDGFVAVAATYLDLGDDLHAEPIPAGLTEAQSAVYREELGKKVEQVWVKSTLYCDKGLEYAARQDWTTAPVPALVAQRALAEARIDEARP